MKELDNNKTCTVIDNETGEILTDKADQYSTKEMRKGTQSYYAHKEVNAKYEEYGAFYWILYGINSGLFDNLDNITLVRLIYLSTFIQYRTNKLVYDNKVPIKYHHIKSVLDVSEKVALRFVRTLIDEDILYADNDGCFYLNKQYFSKGKLRLPQSKCACRIYMQSVRFLYNNTDKKYQKELAYFFRLLPYVNIKYNIICSLDTQAETDIKKINEILFCDLYKLLNVSEVTMRTFRRNLKYIELEDKTKLFGYFYSDNPDKAMIVCNPQIFYKGDYNDTQEVFEQSFKNTK